jgi:hypothetical protein
MSSVRLPIFSPTSLHLLVVAAFCICHSSLAGLLQHLRRVPLLVTGNTVCCPANALGRPSVPSDASSFDKSVLPRRFVRGCFCSNVLSRGASARRRPRPPVRPARCCRLVVLGKGAPHAQQRAGCEFSGRAPAPAALEPPFFVLLLLRPLLPPSSPVCSPRPPLASSLIRPRYSAFFYSRSHRQGRRITAGLPSLHTTSRRHANLRLRLWQC